jgi:hypothetical protein
MASLIRLFATVIFASVLVAFPVAALSTFVAGLSETQIQAALQSHFPSNEYATFARVTLREPKVRLSQNARKLTLVIVVDANVAGDALRRGYMNIAVGLSYKPASGGVYLSNPRLQQFDMPGASPALVTELEAMVEKMAINILPLVRIYKLKEKDLNHSLAKSQLKSYTVEQGQVTLEFGFK